MLHNKLSAEELEGVGRGFANALLEQHHRVERLEQMIICLYENICLDIPSTLFIDDPDDKHVNVCEDIINRVNHLKEK